MKFLNFLYKYNLIYDIINYKLNLDYNYIMKTLHFFLILNLIIIISLLLKKNINSNTLESFQETFNGIQEDANALSFNVLIPI